MIPRPFKFTSHNTSHTSISNPIHPFCQECLPGTFCLSLSYDLIVSTPPGIVRKLDEIQHLQSRLEDLTSQHPGTHFIVLPVDQEQTKWFLENDGFYDSACKNAYIAHCQSIGIDPDPFTAEKAHAFWMATEGCDFVTVGLPQDLEVSKKLYAVLIEFTRTNNLLLKDPQTGQPASHQHP